MKLKFLFLAGVAVALASCGSTKTAKIADIDGSWDIVKINGENIDGDPYIGFDAASGRIFGYAGCNRLLGSFNVNAKPGEISLDKMGSTRMMCPDMTTEDKLTNAFPKVAGYKKSGKNGIELVDVNNHPVISLQRRYEKAKAEKLDKDFLIISIRGEQIPADVMEKPTITFNTAEKSFHGNDGCNGFSGSCEVKGSAITLSSVAATMRACPDMEIEGKVLDTLNHVTKFGLMPDGNIGLFDEGDTLLLELKAK